MSNLFLSQSRLTAMLLLVLVAINACSSSRHQNALTHAQTSDFQKKRIAAPPFSLTSFGRVQAQGQNANLYIEGDGLAWVSRKTPSRDPTPKNPLALRLATQDRAPNVFYLARPCQYSKLITDQPCPQKYWTSHRFAAEVIESMNDAIETLKTQNDITGFHLIGFSGGANIAALLAARRSDILSLRTVAGNLDHETLHRIHKVSQIPHSMNAINIARQINHIPQHHFIGAKDKVVAPAIAESYIRASADQNCIRATILPDTTHQNGWLEAWPNLLQSPLECNNRVQ